MTIISFARICVKSTPKCLTIRLSDINLMYVLMVNVVSV